MMIHNNTSVELSQLIIAAMGLGQKFLACGALTPPGGAVGPLRGASWLYERHIHFEWNISAT
jgi:hypothetical protein